MPDTSPSDNFLPPPASAKRPPVPTPPPADPSPELTEPTDAPDHGESWILLAQKHALRVSDFREIEEAGNTSQETRDESGQPYERTWPLPSLIVNGNPIPTPNWTFVELLEAIGAEVIPPPQMRQWKRGKNLPRATD